MRRRALLALATVGLSACGSSSSSSPPAGPVRPSASSHVVVVVMENEERPSVIGSPDAPYITRLARRYATATNSYAITHPSLPNYLALVSGSTHGIATDCTSCEASGPNLATQLEAKRRTWKAYAEGLPSPCFNGATADAYAKKHDPFAYWASTRCGHRASFDMLDRDLRAGRLPDFAFVTPDLCHDMHDCPVKVGDRFLAGLMPRLLKAIGPHGYVVLTFDEGTTNAGCCGVARGGRIATIVAGRDVQRGRALHTPVTHYGVLRTIEDTFGLGHLGAAADPRNGSLRGLFR
jgi:phosphatidylinositol-3-phosphatase